MKIRCNINSNKIINALVVILICSFVIFVEYAWGRYVILGCLLATVCTQILRDRGTYRLNLSTLTILLLMFILYTLSSALWAKSPSDTITMAKTLAEIFVMVYLLYVCFFYTPQCVSSLLGCITLASYIISVYSICFYGVDFLVEAADTGARLESEYANVNTIGMLAAVGIVIQVDKSLRKKRFGAMFMCLPSVILIALTQSRKALIALSVGIFFCSILHSSDSKNILKKISKLFVSVVLVISLFYVVMSLPIFSGMLKRMNSWISSITGVGSVDNSTLARYSMIEIGWNQFLETPIFGMGMANPHILNEKYLAHDAYLHNNYIELLAGGGLIGLVLYYSMYAYVLTMFLKYRRYKNDEYVICFVLLILWLMLDFAMVSYYNKMRYIYILLWFLEVNQLRRNAAKEHQKFISIAKQE